MDKARPDGVDGFYTEKIIRLPDAYINYMPPPTAGGRDGLNGLLAVSNPAGNAAGSRFWRLQIVIGKGLWPQFGGKNTTM